MTRARERRGKKQVTFLQHHPSLSLSWMYLPIATAHVFDVEEERNSRARSTNRSFLTIQPVKNCWLAGCLLPIHFSAQQDRAREEDKQASLKNKVSPLPMIRLSMISRKIECLTFHSTPISLNLLAVVSTVRTYVCMYVLDHFLVFLLAPAAHAFLHTNHGWRAMKLSPLSSIHS